MNPSKKPFENIYNFNGNQNYKYLDFKRKKISLSIAMKDKDKNKNFNIIRAFYLEKDPFLICNLKKKRELLNFFKNQNFIFKKNK